ncbi:MAG: hypothetical protein WD068_00995 [Candidatus Babeliales bacterium]
MKKIFSILFILLLSFSLSAPLAASNCESCDDSCTIDCSVTCTSADTVGDCGFFCQGHFAPRSQASDTARRLVGRNLYLYRYEENGYYGTFSITPEVTRSFRTEELGRYLSPIADCNCFTVGQEALADIRGEDFGLNCTGTGNQVCLNPRVTNFLVEFSLFLGLDECWKGLFVDIHLPVVHTWWDTNCCLDASTTCSATFPSCLMSTNQTNTAVGTTNVVQALNGDFVWGDVNAEMCFGKLCCRPTKTGVADLQVNIGYNFWTCEDYHVAAKLVVKAPTGNKPNARFLFEPIVGNGGHWELGGGLTAHYILWNQDDNCNLAFHLDSEVTHLFGTGCETRLFDLCANGCYSRYLLLKKFSNNGTTLDGLERGPNVFAQNLSTSISVQGDVTALLSYKSECWLFDLGYNFWGRSQEQCDSTCFDIPEKTYGIKGIQPMCNGASANLTTASQSTIQESIGTDGQGDAPNIPIFVSNKDLNVYSALAPSAISNAFVFHAGYLWESSDYTPYLGLGGKIEFSGDCNTTLDQWALWLKGGLTF